MIKTLKNACFSLAILLACSSVAFADGNAFTPLNFDDVSYTSPNSKTTKTAPAAQADTVGNTQMQNAIVQLDNAQVDVRNDLLNVKAKYADVDAQYQSIKVERKNLNKQIRTIERRINKIEKQKEAIRKNMI